MARSRGDARDLVRTGLVRVAGVAARKPSQAVDADTDLAVDDAAPRWVGRAAHKLLAALDHWAPRGLTAQDRRCVDVGASTGGFTEVLLARGARRVVAVDVGHGQLVPTLAADPRVEDRSGTSIRGLRAADVGGPADLVVADLSFISLTLVASDLAGLLDEGGDLLVLVKPQFEVGRARLASSGVVREPAERAAAVERVIAALEATGVAVHGLIPSPISGGAGNAEYLVWARRAASGRMSPDEVAAAVRAATARPPGGRE
ncbi:TlyA family RNA methyltransferase [Phycicoccus endophyticus]|uniref:TlyA family RNA methyltransferase n=2 Tax=Phycicoccus endophyticus TaxID=1690220 RepID=A0A7G9R5P1_9MICO|nr:TlyA family RNA methyltransferase [Phycicoccus endophyticus]QNN50916.1 TlyA family RNA methyltransferase [Phycicoccus endophyticus]